MISWARLVPPVIAAITTGEPGETFVPRVPSARMVDVAAALIGERPIPTVITGIRPGEKIHEILVSDEEAYRTIERGGWYAILPMLPEVCGDRRGDGCLTREFSSRDCMMDLAGVRELLTRRRLLVEDASGLEGELLR